MTNKGNSKKIKRHYEPCNDWIQFPNRSEIRNKCKSSHRKKHRNIKTNQLSQTRAENTAKNNPGKFKNNPNERVVSKGSNVIEVKPKTFDNIMGLEMSSILPGSTIITDQSLCTILSCQKINKSVKQNGNDDSNNTENYEAIIFKNICITGKKLSLWKKIKYRCKSLTSAQLLSQADNITTNKSSTRQLINEESSKAKKDFGIERKLEHYTKLKSNQTFIRDYLVMHCQKTDVAHSKNSLEKELLYFKTPARKNQSTQQFSKSMELLSTACLKLPVISFPENEEETPKNSIITTLTQKLLHLTKELASKICRSAIDIPCDCEIKSSVSDNNNFKKSECIEALCKVEGKCTQPSDHSKKKKLSFKVDEEKNTKTTSQDIVEAKFIKPMQASKSFKNICDKKPCDFINDCKCTVSKRIESSEKIKICRNINKKQNNFCSVTKNLKNNRTSTEECFKKHNVCACKNLQPIETHGIFKACKNLNQNHLYNNVKNNVKAKKKNKCIKLHSNCECGNAMSSKTSKPCRDLNPNVQKITNGGFKSHNAYRCTNSETNESNNGTCKNIQQNQVFIANPEKNVKNASVNIFTRCFNCKPKRIRPESRNNTAHCTKINSKKDSRALETADLRKNINTCNKKKQKHIKVRSKSNQYLQISKTSDSDVRKRIAVRKSCNNSNVGLDSSKHYPDKCNNKIVSGCVKIKPKSRYTQHSTCSNSLINSTKAQCGDSNAENVKNDRKMCSNISERPFLRPHIAKINQNPNCIPQKSMAKTDKMFCDKACFTISKDHCSKGCYVNFSKPCYIKKPVKSCNQNKTKLTRPNCGEKLVPHCKNKTNRRKFNKQCEKCYTKHFYTEHKCKAMFKETCCAIRRICKQNCSSKHIDYDLNCNELFLDTLKQKPHLFFQKSGPSYQDFLKCCCMWSQCTQMVCIFIFWCPFVLMFEIFRRCFCCFFD